MDCHITSAIAEHLRVKRNARVVKWNARGMGGSEGGNELSGFIEWMGMRNCEDYKVRVHMCSREIQVLIQQKDIFKEQVLKFVNDFPSARGCDLFVCVRFSKVIWESSMANPSL